MVRLNPEAREVIVGPREALLTAKISLKEINWLGGEDTVSELPVSVKIRSIQDPVAARLTLAENETATVEFADPETGVAPGQACVFYDRERVLGGGWIARTKSTFAN